MFKDIETYFITNVLQNFNDLRARLKEKEYGQDKDIRLAINCATSLYHLREHLPENLSWKKVNDECPEYSLLGDVVNVSKHGSISRYNPQVTSADSIEERIVITEYYDKEGIYNDAEKEVVVHLDNGEVVDLEILIIQVLNYWIDKLAGYGVELDKMEPLKKSQPVSRDQASNDLDMSYFGGLGFTSKYVLMKYDYELGKRVPIDIENELEGIQYRIFSKRERHQKGGVEISFQGKLTGDWYKVKVDLNNFQLACLKSQKNKKLQKSYLSKILPQSEEWNEKMGNIHQKEV